MMVLQTVTWYNKNPRIGKAGDMRQFVHMNFSHKIIDMDIREMMTTLHIEADKLEGLHPRSKPYVITEEHEGRYEGYLRVDVKMEGKTQPECTMVFMVLEFCRDQITPMEVTYTEEASTTT